MKRLNHAILILLTLLLSFTMFLFVGCDKSQQAGSGITGVVSVEGGSPQGAVVLLYNQVDIGADVSIWSVPKNSSAVGFEYQTEVGFDFRTIPALKTDTVGPNGEFSFSDLSDGKYIVVAAKDSNDGDDPGFGWTDPKEISVGSDEVDAGTFNLFPETVYGLTVLTENTTWQADRHYVLTNTFFLNNGVTLTIQPGAVVRLSQNVVMNIYGTLICDGTPSDFIYFEAEEFVNRSPNEWGPLRFYEEATPPNFRYTVFRHADIAVNSSADGGVFEYCYFYRILSTGIYASPSVPEVRRCMFERAGTGIEARFAHDLLCEHSVFQTSDPVALYCLYVDTGTVYCNWFRDCGGADSAGSGTRGVLGLHWIDDFEISRNFVETSWYALSLGSGVNSSNNIHHNEFTRCNRVMNVGVSEDLRGPSNPRFNFNCFTTINLSVIFMEACQHNNLVIDASNNFWNTNSVQFIQDHMLNDCHQNVLCPCIQIEPIELTCPPDVGICSN